MSARSAAAASPLSRIGFVLAMAGFVSSTLVHVATFFGVALDAHGAGRGVVWVLHLGAMALAGPLILMGAARAPAWRPSARWRATMRDAPPWGKRVYELLFLTFLAQFGALLFVTRGTAPRELPSLPLHETRMFSAGWMLVFVLCALAWWPSAGSHLDRDRSDPAA